MDICINTDTMNTEKQSEKNDKIQEDNRSLPQILQFQTNGNKVYELATTVHAFNLNHQEMEGGKSLQI